MEYYFILYAFSITLSLLGGGFLFHRHRNISGFSFLLSTIFTSAWFVFYFLFFSGIQDVQTLLILSRLGFLVGIFGVYSFLSFIYFFDIKPGKIWSKKLALVCIPPIILTIIYVFTGSIVASLEYVPAAGVFREVEGPFFLFHVALHSLWFIFFLYFSFKKLKTETLLNRARLRNILFFAFLLVFSLVLFQLILPIFGIWLMEKEIIFFFTLFVLSVVFSLKRYYFQALGYGVGKVVIFAVSIVSSMLVLYTLKNFYIKTATQAMNYWVVYDKYSIIDSMLAVAFFMIIFSILSRVFLGETRKIESKKKLQKLQRNLSYLTRMKDLNDYLRPEMKRIFRTHFSEVRIFQSNEPKTQMQRYFEDNLSEDIFINDLVFIEEKKSKLQKAALLSEIPPNTFLIFPLFNKDGNKNVGVFIVGVKSFGDFYTTDEIGILREFVFFLELHLKFIHTYKQIEDLSLNLDKKVDEKTMEYNDLINKQKEFISVISHEIKSPIANAIFQADALLDDLENHTLSPDDTLKELHLINAQLIKTGELTNRLFTVQYYDTREIALFREKVQISNLLTSECEMYSHLYTNISFIDEIDRDIGFIDIDRIQFQQVITNIIQNAVKFLDKTSSKIRIRAYRENHFLHVIIEDNGKGFKNIDITNIFEKYTTGSGGGEGLGMGLYLCKKIIEMHEGTILATVSDSLGGAKFHIAIPIPKD